MKHPAAIRALALATALLAAGAAVSATRNAIPRIPAYVASAVKSLRLDPAREARRHPAEIAAFAQVKPGDKVVDLIPGGVGFFSRVFSAIVGPRGKVYGIWPNEYDQDELPAFHAVAADLPNEVILNQPGAAFSTPEPVDVVFTSQNYHDYPDKFMGRIDPMVLNRAVFASLKPGGVYVVIDHAAEAGSGLRDTNTLHRIDPAIVRSQVEAAGFVFEAESDILRNPADDHKLLVFDKAIRGHTDQFMYRFRKPRTAR